MLLYKIVRKGAYYCSSKHRNAHETASAQDTHQGLRLFRKRGSHNTKHSMTENQRSSSTISMSFDYKIL